jgi:6-carboxyhexanoate--CoA ligase
MTQDTLYNIRMRASCEGKHISGAERIVSSDGIEIIVHELISRALRKSRTPDDIVLHVESLGNASPQLFPALDVITVGTQGPDQGRSAASRVLQRAGVTRNAIDTAIDHLDRGAALSGGNMRGAMVMDAETGERLEPDRERGVRATRFDWTDEGRRSAEQLLSGVGLTHFRTREALALATKVVHAPGVIAEICWSDDPDYTAGYVASRKTGYVRFPFLKRNGDEKGGRAIFIDRNDLDLAALLHYLQNQAVLINAAGKCSSVVAVDAYFAHVSAVQPSREKGL